MIPSFPWRHHSRNFHLPISNLQLNCFSEFSFHFHSENSSSAPFIYPLFSSCLLVTVLEIEPQGLGTELHLQHFLTKSFFSKKVAQTARTCDLPASASQSPDITGVPILPGSPVYYIKCASLWNPSFLWTIPSSWWSAYSNYLLRRDVKIVLRPYLCHNIPQYIS